MAAQEERHAEALKRMEKQAALQHSVLELSMTQTTLDVVNYTTILSLPKLIYLNPHQAPFLQTHLLIPTPPTSLETARSRSWPTKWWNSR